MPQMQLWYATAITNAAAAAAAPVLELKQESLSVVEYNATAGTVCVASRG